MARPCCKSCGDPGQGSGSCAVVRCTVPVVEIRAGLPIGYQRPPVAKYRLITASRGALDGREADLGAFAA